jgi:Cytochrome P450
MATTHHLAKFGESNIQFSIVVGLTVTVIVVSISLWKYRNNKSNRRFPAFASIKFQTFVDSFVTGQVHRLHLKLCTESGLVYRIPTGTWSPFIVIHDPTVARIIIEGSSHHGIPESEKSTRYKLLTRLTNGVQTMLTKQTSERSWEPSRKAVAPSFSNTNLSKVIPELQTKLDQFKDILDAHILQSAILTDFPEWMIRVTIDVLGASMFRTDFQTLQSHSFAVGASANPDPSVVPDVESDGQLFVRSYGIMAKEFMMRSPLQPWRKYLFWNKNVMKEISDANIAAGAVADIGKRLLEGYRLKYSEEELLNDKSILGHLIRRYIYIRPLYLTQCLFTFLETQTT